MRVLPPLSSHIIKGSTKRFLFPEECVCECACGVSVRVRAWRQTARGGLMGTVGDVPTVLKRPARPRRGACAFTHTHAHTHTRTVSLWLSSSHTHTDTHTHTQRETPTERHTPTASPWCVLTCGVCSGRKPPDVADTSPPTPYLTLPSGPSHITVSS